MATNRMRCLIAGCLSGMFWMLPLPPATAAPAVPGELEAWRAWVLDGQEFRRCPFLSQTAAVQPEHFVCAWPGRMSLALTARGGTFVQEWQVFAESWLQLPGGPEHWPQDVRVNGAMAAVVARGGAPHVRLPAGQHRISGTFGWETRPESLAVPGQTGIVDLTLDGREIVQPERLDGNVWLGKRRSVEQQEQLAIQVYRLVQDEIPTQLTTLVQLQVAGEAREVLLAAPLPEGFRPLGLTGGLPAQLDANGRLRVQLRAGSWQIRLLARAPSVQDTLQAPAAGDAWAREEIWSVAGNDRLRVAAAEGVTAVDPVQAGVPGEWRDYPAFRLASGETLKLVERSRGLSTGDENRLTLRRELWLDFGHRGLTAVDILGGQMRRDWRLEMAPPWTLLSARRGEENLLVTVGAGAQRTGVEVRSPAVNLRTVSRTEAGLASTATGWLNRFDSVQGVLHLPPGHRLLAVFGADDAPLAWIERWRLLDMFLVLIMGLAVGRLVGWPAGAIALAGLVLVRHDSGPQIWLWINLLVALVLARFTPEGRLKRVTAAYRGLAFFALLCMLIPFVASQARLALYPQLDVQWSRPVPLAGDGITKLDTVVPPPPEVPIMAEPNVPAESMPLNVTPPEIQVQGSREKSSDYRLQPYTVSPVSQRYAPGTLVQTGPGVPQWNYSSYPYSWSGPVEPSQQVRFAILTPVWLGLWRIAGCVLLIALLGCLAQLAFPARRILPRFMRPALAPLVAVAMAATFVGSPGEARADIPDNAVLQELKARLTRAPECAPDCAGIDFARVIARPDRVEVELRVSALADVAVPVPAAAGRWEPESISVDGETRAGLYRDGRGVLWVALKPGAHVLRLAGRIVAAESVQLEFALAPRRIETGGEGWEFAGVNNGRLMTGTLELVRRRAASSISDAVLETSKQFAPFVRVTRYINMDLDWTVTTVVERLAPEKGAFTIAVPLLPGEQVITDGMQARMDRTVLAALSAGEDSIEWRSGLPRTESLELTMDADAGRTEVWSFAVGPQWRVEIEGSPVILPRALVEAPADENLTWSHEYHPRAGEKVTARITRPKAATGQTLAIDTVMLAVSAGRRSSNTALNLRYRSTQGGRHSFRLPADARVTSVMSDGNTLALRPQDGELTVALSPGEHQLEIRWQTDEGAGMRTRAPVVDLDSPASNIHTRLTLPQDRWVLFAYGPGVGPAILFWSELVVFLVLAWFIGRSRYSPLRVHEWLLLGMGLSTFSWSVLLIFALWMFLMRWRESWSAEVSYLRFNWRQVALGVFSVVTLVSLVAAIPHGLLGWPDMRVEGAGSHDFGWFLDRTEGVLPGPGVISVSLWWYKAAMLLWALWLSFALLRWLPWAWRLYVRDGLWRSPPPRTPPAPKDGTAPAAR